MAISYYDQAIVEKLNKWIPKDKDIRILGVDDTRRLIESKADDTGDAPLTLPFFALSRGKDITITSNTKQDKSFNGIKLRHLHEEEFLLEHEIEADKSYLINVIPIDVTYQLDVYAKKQSEAEEYIRELIFKFINNPKLVITFPYSGLAFTHTANLRVGSVISDTSDIPSRLFKGQFYRWSIKLDLHDGMLINVPYKHNWSFDEVYLQTVTPKPNGDVLTEKVCEIKHEEDKN